MPPDRYIVRQPRIDLAQLTRGHLAMPGVLKRLGYTAFRKGQDNIVSCIMAGHDTLGILPTSCHAPGQEIMMADGSLRKVEDIRVGDKVMGWDGTSRDVTHIKSGVAPCSRIIPHKRPSFIVTDQHLLTLVRTSEKADPKYPCQRHGGEVLDVSVSDHGKWAKWRKHIHKLFCVPIAEFHRSLSALYIDPYFMGVLLGDGGFTGSVPTVSKPDPEIIAECKRQAEAWNIGCTVKPDPDSKNVNCMLHNNGKHKNPLRLELERLKLWGLLSESKFIPADYKYSNLQTRYALLAGLLDTDGHNDGGGFDFISASKQLAEDVVFLARSVGCSANGPTECQKSCQNDFTGTYWRCFVSGKTLTQLPLKIERKKVKITIGSKRDALRFGFKVESIGDHPFHGITITGDGRYLMGDFMVTHNTGKTACFVAPTLALGWRTLVFSPLISLMHDQQQALSRKGVRVGNITSHNPQMNVEFMRQWRAGDLEILYVAPERLKNEEFLQTMRAMPPDMTAVDEAHCLSSWSDTFRHAYCVIGDFITEFQPRVVTALTATCPPRVEEDIRRVLCMEKATKVMHYPRRTNLDLRSLPGEGTLPIVPLLERKPGPALVYCVSKKATELTASELGKYLGQEVGFYHGGLKKSLRSHTQDRFMHGDLDIVCATNAFGMGIDKENVRLLVHRDITGSAEAQAQEMGRAGRDGKYALCQTFFSNASINTHRFLINMSSPSFDDVEKVYRALQKLADPSGLVTAGDDAIAKAAYMNGSWSLPAIYQILSGAQVINKVKDKEKICSVRLRNRIDDPKLMELLDILQIRGDPGDDGYTDISMPILADELDVAPATVSKRLNDWSKAGVLEYVPPDRSRPVQLLGDIKAVEAARVDGLRQISFAKLQQTIVYGRDIADANKHEYLETCLGVTPPHHAG